MMVFNQIKKKVPAPKVSASLIEDLDLNVSSDSSDENSCDDMKDVESLV